MPYKSDEWKDEPMRLTDTGEEDWKDLPEPKEEAPPPPLEPQEPPPKPKSYPPLIARKPSPEELAYLGRAIKGILVGVAGMGYEKAGEAVVDLLQRPITP